MGDFWFYLEPYTFLWVKKQDVLLYNTLSGKILLYKESNVVSDLFQRLLDADNIYCAQLSALELEDPKVNTVINEVRDSFSGDLLPVTEINGKPLVLPPILNFQKDIKRMKESTEMIDDHDIVLNYGNDILGNLTDLDIYINGECALNCNYCAEKGKQIPYCTKSENSLSVKDIRKVLECVANKSFKVNILGGNILLHPAFEEIVTLLNEYKANKTYSIYYKNVDGRVKSLIENSKNKVKVLFDAPIDTNLFSEIVTQYGKYNNFLYLFSVSSEEEFEDLQNLVSEYFLPLKNVDIKLLYNGENFNFFEKNVFMNKEDFEDVKLSRRQIFMHQEVNTNNFGKLTVIANGQVKANNSSFILGTVQDDLRLLIYKEMTDGDSWLRIRNQEPCCDCVFQWLCPSPSNYETTLGRPNLCHVNS